MCRSTTPAKAKEFPGASRQKNRVYLPSHPLNSMQPVLMMAPFRGLSLKAYRQALARHIGGYDSYYAPFISGTGTTSIHPSKLVDLPAANDGGTTTIPQLISNRADEIILLGNALYERGYDELNWNLGCPFARIANKKRGCGLLPHPEEIERILDKVCRELKPRLSVKTRLGKTEPGEILRILPVFNQYPIKHIILHPRTGKQLYRGKARAEAFKECLKHSAHPLVYNGDIYHAGRLKKLQELLPGQRHWMLGRGALINPFLAREIRGHFISDNKKREGLEAFHRSLWEHAKGHIFPEKRQIGWMKALWHYLSGLFAHGEHLFCQIKRAQDSGEYLRAAHHAIAQEFAGDKGIEAHFMRLTR